MTVHTNKILVQRYYEEMWNTWNFALTDELLSAEISFRGSLGVEALGRMAFCEYMRQVRNASRLSEQDRAIGRGRRSGYCAFAVYGCHRGEIFGVWPSGKSINYAGVAFFRVAGSRVAEGWVLGDIVSFLRQLGAQTLPNHTN